MFELGTSKNSSDAGLGVQEDEKKKSHTAIIWDTVKKPQFNKLNNSYLALKVKRTQSANTRPHNSSGAYSARTITLGYNLIKKS